ncbi:MULTISPECIES: hypothetical protein [Gammaproteobacteria]|uniref:hypothetical protein n=1 Tax=Gammaproteobacteria TaxID=1236 RepID=UPI001B81ABFF|nr:hypothetical protein [Pseudomonas juntendi]MBR7523311.1 hypothetical protein [Pseudomonas juntendi]
MFEPEGKAAATRREVKRRIFLAVAATIVSVGWAILCFIVPVGTDPGAWFARSGAIVTVFALLNESQLTEEIGRLTNELRADYLAILNGLRFATLLSAVAGTLVWGYGDLLFP